MGLRTSARQSGLVCLAAICCLVVLLATVGAPFALYFVIFVVGGPPLFTLIGAPSFSNVMPLRIIPAPLLVSGGVVHLFAVARSPVDCPPPHAAFWLFLVCFIPLPLEVVLVLGVAGALDVLLLNAASCLVWYQPSPVVF